MQGYVHQGYVGPGEAIFSPLPTTSSTGSSYPLLQGSSTSARQVIPNNQPRHVRMVSYQPLPPVGPTPVGPSGPQGHLVMVPQPRPPDQPVPQPRPPDQTAPSTTAAAQENAHASAGVHELHLRIPPENWCVSREDLDEFEAEIKYEHEHNRLFDDDRSKTGLDKIDIGPSVHIVTEKLIKPRTKAEGGMSWALMKNRRGLKCDLFATHCWQEGVLEFIIKVRKAWPMGAKGLWACFLAMPQNCDITAVIGSDPSQSPFAQAVQTASHIVVVPNHKTSIYERLWCVYEAYVAMNELQQRNELTIQIPLTAHPMGLVLKTAPGLVFPAIGVVLGVFYLGPFIGFLLGPVMWLLTTYFMCTMISRISTYFLTKNVHDHKQSCQIMITVCYVELFVVGIGSGLAWWHLFGVECKSHMKLFEGLCMPSNLQGDGLETVSKMIFGVKDLGFRFEHGEEVSVMLVLATLVLVYLWHIFLLLIRKCIEMEGSLLDFDTVMNANCSVERDKEMIMGTIEEKVPHIDRMIKMLKSIGRYNSAVKENVDLGLPWEACRNGIDYFKLAAAVTLWEFWWITDLCGRKKFTAGLLLPALTVLVLEALVCYIGELSVHAINTSLVVGIIFVMISNHHLFFTHLAVESLSMSISTLWLQLVFFVFLLLVNIWFYTGGRRNTVGGDVMENVLTCSNCQELTSDEEAFHRIQSRANLYDDPDSDDDL